MKRGRTRTCRDVHGLSAESVELMLGAAAGAMATPREMVD